MLGSEAKDSIYRYRTSSRPLRPPRKWNSLPVVIDAQLGQQDSIGQSQGNSSFAPTPHQGVPGVCCDPEKGIRLGATGRDSNILYHATCSLAADVEPDVTQLYFRYRGEQIKVVLPEQETIQGGMGTVARGFAMIHGREEQVAVKISSSYDSEIDREKTHWSRLDHPNVLPLYGVCAIGIPFLHQIGLISPFMRNGNLQDFLERNEWCDRLSLMVDVARGLNYLHNDAAIVHGDIKATNILISDSGRALLADFGLSTTVAPRDELTAERLRDRYSLSYCAPEVIDGNAHYPSSPGVVRSKTMMTDIYALGILLYQTYGGKLPNRQSASYKFTGDIERGKLPPRPSNAVSVCCDDIWAMCVQCWSRDPTSRPLVSVILHALEDLQVSPERQAPMIS